MSEVTRILAILAQGDARAAHVLGIEQSAAVKRYFRVLQDLKENLPPIPRGQECL